MTIPELHEAQAASDRASARWRRPRWQLAAALVLVLAVALGGGALVSLNADDQASVVDRPSPPTSSVARPAQFVAVTGDGRLVVVDSETGEELRQLAYHGDPTEEALPPLSVPPPSFIADATVTPDGSTVYYDVSCCGAGKGSIYRVSTSGGEPARIYDGASPTVSPDGRLLAFLDAPYVRLVNLATEVTRRFEDHAGSEYLFDLAWSADGSALVYARAVLEEARAEVVLLDVATDRSDLDARILKATDGAEWHVPRLPSGDRLTVAEQYCRYIDSSETELVLRTVDVTTGEVVSLVDQTAPASDSETDSSGQWSLDTYTDGHVVWSGGGGRRELGGDVGELGNGYVSADW